MNRGWAPLTRAAAGAACNPSPHLPTPCVVAGEKDVTTGASSDLEQATRLARAMVTRYGMSDRIGQVGMEGWELGWRVANSGARQGWAAWQPQFTSASRQAAPHCAAACYSHMHLRPPTHLHPPAPQISINYEDDGRSLSSETRAAVEEEVKSLLSAAYARAKGVLKQHEKELHALAQVDGGGAAVCVGKQQAGVRAHAHDARRLSSSGSGLQPSLLGCTKLPCPHYAHPPSCTCCLLIHPWRRS